MELTFNEKGKLLNGNLSRYRPGQCRSLSVRVLLPVKYLDQEMNTLKAKAAAAYNALHNDSSSILFRMLDCSNGGSSLRSKLKDIIRDKDPGNWLPDKKGKFVSEHLSDYIRFMKAIKNKDTATLNALKPFAPFGLKIKGLTIQDDCIEFTNYYTKNDTCNCLSPNSEYVALRFFIPPKMLLENVALDSFQLIRKFHMKEKAVDWYNKQLGGLKKDEKIAFRVFEQQLRSKLDTISSLSITIDSLIAIRKILCTDNSDELKVQVEERICTYKKSIDNFFGHFDCGDKCSNALLCSEILRTWIAKMVWLNGDKIRLNPFNFTSTENFVPLINLGNARSNIELLKQKQDAAARLLDFSKAEYSHLRDSILRDKTTSFEEGRGLLSKIQLQIDSANVILAQKIPDLGNDGAEANAARAKEFLTFAQVNYKGWLVPYDDGETNPARKIDKMWLRHYYLDQSPNFLRQKLHYTYPENENVTLLLHNMPGGTAAAFTESFKPFADSALFTSQAGEFVAQAAALYASLSSVAPMLKKAFEIINVKKNDSKPPTGPTIDINLAGIVEEPMVFDPESIPNNATTFAKKSPQKGNPAIGAFITDNKNNVLRFLPSKYITSDTIKQIAEDYNLRNFIPDSLRIYRAYERKIKADNADDAFEQIRNYYRRDNNLNYITVNYRAMGKKEFYISKDNPGQTFNEIKDAIREYEPKGVCNVVFEKCYSNYLEALYTLATSPAFISEELEEVKDESPIYKTEKYRLADQEAPYKNVYTISTYHMKNGEAVKDMKVDSSYINIGKFHYVQTAAGIAYTPKAGFITSVDTANGQFNISRDEDRFRLIAGLRIYPFGLYNQKNPVSLFREFRWVHRLSILMATGVTKPLQNMYAGGGFDIVPGLNLSAGWHFQQRNRYEIENNQVKARSIGYQGKAFYSITIDPNLLINAVKSLIK